MEQYRAQLPSTYLNSQLPESQRKDRILSIIKRQRGNFRIEDFGDPGYS